jgi:small-conductance mechanosensitive channel
MAGRRGFSGFLIGMCAWLLLAAVDFAPVLAQAPPADAVDPEEVDVAPVILDGRQLFQIRGLSTYPADQRAKKIAKRLAAAAGDYRVSPDSLFAVPNELGLLITAGSHEIMTVLDADARLEKLTVPEFAAGCRLRIKDAIVDYRRDREPGRMLRNGILVVVVSAGLALLLFVFARVARRAERWLTARYKRTEEATRGRAFEVISTDRLWWLLRMATGAIRIVVVVVLVYLYLQWALELFPWTRHFGRTLLSLVSNPVRAIVDGFVGYLPELFFLVILMLFARWAMRVVKVFFTAVEHGTVVLPDFDPEWAQPTFRIVRTILYALLVVVAYPYIPGSGSGAFKGVSLMVGVLFSLGSSSIVANLIAGYSMIYRRAFRVGDRIRINDHIGDVIAIRALVTSLRTPKNEEIIIPNSEILNNPILNYSAMAREGALILHTTVGIGYEVPWRQVEAMLLMAAERTEGLRRDRPAFVLQTSLGDFCVVYEINVYCDSAQRMAPLYTALHQNIQDVFNEYGVQIMTPAYEGDPETPKVVPPERWHERPAAGPGA